MSHSKEFDAMTAAAKAQACLDLLSEDEEAMGVLRQSILVNSFCRNMADEIQEAGNNEAVAWAAVVGEIIDAMLGLQLLYPVTADRIDVTLQSDPLFLQQARRGESGKAEN